MEAVRTPLNLNLWWTVPPLVLEVISQMSDSDWDFCFRGVDGDECMSFIRQVRRKALETRKSRDKEWMADYAVSCFAENAMKWSMGVSPEVLEDWGLLQKALMEEYCDYRTSSAEPPAAAGMTPAAAPPISPAATLSATGSATTGYIRIFAENTEVGNYVSRVVDPVYGVFRSCAGRHEAVQVRLVPFMSNYGIQLLDFSEPYCWLGACLAGDLEDNDARIGPASFANLCPTSAPASHAMGTSAKSLIGPARSNIWHFQSLDSSITALWTNCDFIYVLQPMVNVANKRVLAVSNCPKFVQQNSDLKYSKARLVFELA